MKRIGIIGGTTPESTVLYYEYITRTYTERFGDFGFPETVIFSVSFQDYVDWMEQENWDRIARELGNAAVALEKAGADFIVIATNTLHLVIDQVRRSCRIPLISIIDTTARAVQKAGLNRVALLGTRFTMQKPFYRQGLEAYGIDVLTPSPEDQERVNRVIFEELGTGIVKEESRTAYVRIIRSLMDRGARGIILGCTEIPLLIRDRDVPVPLFNTTHLHAEAALQAALEEGGQAVRSR